MSIEVLVATDSEARMLGYATSSTFRARAAYATTVETTVYLAAGATGRGVGAALYCRLLPILAAEGLHRAVAGIALPNDASLCTAASVTAMSAPTAGSAINSDASGMCTGCSASCLQQTELMPVRGG